ncbi:amidase [Rhodobacteraceae bacterium D3-12]|nr:amidase [Rhodobacteraceae bacterium D3-12]
MSDDLTLMSAAEMVARFAKRSLSPVEACEAALARVETIQPELNAFCVIDPDSAMAAARESEARYAKGAALGPVDGVPSTLKDLVLTKGWPTRRGSRTIPEDGPWDEDGPATARMREGGAVLLGKTTTPEFAFKPVTDSPLCGITRNPWNPELTPGGSSGGAGAAAATGAGTLAMGTDAGGSIRIPACFCGVFGHKPTGGRVPTHPPTPLSSLVSFGPMTRTVEDAARMLSVLARPDARDGAALPFENVAYHERLQADPAEWRVAYSPDMGFADMDPEVAALVKTAAQAFVDMGAKVEQVERVIDDPSPLMGRLLDGYFDFAFRDFGEDKFAIMDPEVVEQIRESRGANLHDHLQAEMERTALMRQMAEFHERFDFLLTPTLTIPPFSAEVPFPEGQSLHSWTKLCVAFNLTRQPAASVPCGFTRAGLPVGLQIVGRFGDDLGVLRASRAFELARPWADRRPQIIQ